MSSINTTSRNDVINRLFAAFIVGFIFTNIVGIALVLLSPFDRVTSISWITVLAFAFYSALIMWVFHTPSLKKIWLVLIGGIISSSAISFTMIYLERIT